MNNKKLLLIIFFIFMFALFGKHISKPALANTTELVAMIFGDGQVLGDEDEQENKQEEEQENDEDEQEDEKDDEDEQADDHSSEEEIKNAMGSTTYIKRQEEAGKVEVEMKTYDSSGKLIEEKKLKSEDHDDEEGQELQLENKVYGSGDLKELKIKTKAGKELEVTVKQSVNPKQPSKLEYKVKEQELKIKVSEKRNLYIRHKDDHLEINDGVLGAQVELPLTVDPDNGEVFVETVVGLVKLGISPDKAKQILEEQADFSYNQENIDLVEGGNGLEYKVATQKQEKLLWFIPVEVAAQYTVDAETGDFTGMDQSFWIKVLDLISF